MKDRKRAAVWACWVLRMLFICRMLLMCIGCADKEEQMLQLMPIEGEEAADDTADGSVGDANGRGSAAGDTVAEDANAGDLATGDTTTDKTTDTTTVAVAVSAEAVAIEIGVYACGAISIPGVYYFPEGTRIHEALQAAGGMTDDAATDYLNQAEVMYDGQRLYVPTLTEVEEGLVPKEASTSSGAGASGAASGGGVAGINATGSAGADSGQSTILVNINTATAEELKTLPGVGDAKAKSIIAYRENVGGYQKKEDIMLVEGIKEGMYAKLKEYIEVQ